MLSDIRFEIAEQMIGLECSLEEPDVVLLSSDAVGSDTSYEDQPACYGMPRWQGP
jgi:hypothetical protein